MSLFKARDWWSATLGEGEEFDHGCLCVGDVDNSGTGHGQYVVRNRCTKLRNTAYRLRECENKLSLLLKLQFDLDKFIRVK